MKKIKLLLLLLLLTTASAYSQLQQIKIVSFTVKNQLPAVIDNWGSTPGSLLLVAQLPPNVQVKGIRLMVQIKAGGAIICSNNSAGGLQVDEFTTRTFSANELTGTLQGCHDLKEGSYSICVQFYNVDRVAISNEVCKEFNVESAREPEYTPPTLINPENGKVFTEAELSRPVTFRWTPVVPKPQQAVTYRLKVWQLMQGQNSTEAMRTNQPIVTKDVDNITQAVVSGIYTGPCKPPYLCDFVWQVQALTREGKPIGKNEGKSDSYTFKVETNTGNSTAPQLVSPNEGKAFTASEMLAPVMFRWTPVVPKPQSVTYRLKVWQLMQGQSGSQAMRSNQPIVTKDVDNITQAVVSGIYTGPCRPPYLCDFVWQVQALNREDKPIGNNEGKSELWSFKVSETPASVITNVFPEDKKVFAEEEAKKGVAFRWTPIVPKPQEPVSYRLKVWQLMQGQSGAQAMRENKPIVEKEMMLTEATIGNIYTGPCKPPYLCDFIWNVQAVNRQGNPVAESQPTAFSVATSDCNVSLKIDSIKCTKEKDQLGNPIYKAFMTLNNTGTNPLNLNNALNISTNPYAIPNTYTPKYVINTNAIAYTNTSLIPAIVNTSGPISFSTDVSMPISATKLITRFTLYDNISIASCNPIDSLPLPLCICTDCKDAVFTINSPSVSVTNATTGIYTATGNINITGITPIYAIEIQVQSYNYSATPATCTNGVSSVENSGVINLSGTTINALPVSMLNETVSGLPSTNNGVAKNIKLISASPLPSTMPFNIVFGLPTPLAGLNNDCCKMKFDICLRVKVFYDKDKCNSCSFLYCFPQFTN